MYVYWVVWERLGLDCGDSILRKRAGLECMQVSDKDVLVLFVGIFRSHNHIISKYHLFHFVCWLEILLVRVLVVTVIAT